MYGSFAGERFHRPSHRLTRAERGRRHDLAVVSIKAFFESSSQIKNHNDFQPAVDTQILMIA